MSSPHTFTPAEDMEIVLSRSVGVTYRTIGKSLGLTAEMVRKRYLQLLDATNKKAAERERRASLQQSDA
jgi:hypothetical protein